MHCARIARDVVQRSQYIQGLCDFHFLDQQARRTPFVFCSNSDLQVSVHCWQWNKDWMCIQRDKFKGIFQVQSTRCPVTLDQWDCSQNVLEELVSRQLFPKLSEQYWYLRLDPPPAAKQAFHRSSDQFCICEWWFRRWNFILQNSIAPSSSRCNVWLCRRRLMTFFERSYESRSCFDGSMSIHLLSRNGIVVVKADSLVWGFAFACDLAATTLELVWYILLFLWICKIFRDDFNRIGHISDCSVGNSDPRMRIVLVHGLNSNFNPNWSAENWSWLPIQVQFSYFLGSTLLVESSVVLVEGCIRDKPLIEIV